MEGYDPSQAGQDYAQSMQRFGQQVDENGLPIMNEMMSQNFTTQSLEDIMANFNDQQNMSNSNLISAYPQNNSTDQDMSDLDNMMSFYGDPANGPLQNFQFELSTVMPTPQQQRQQRRQQQQVASAGPEYQMHQQQQQHLEQQRTQARMQLLQRQQLQQQQLQLQQHLQQQQQRQRSEQLNRLTADGGAMLSPYGNASPMYDHSGQTSPSFRSPTHPSSLQTSGVMQTMVFDAQTAMFGNKHADNDNNQRPFQTSSAMVPSNNTIVAAPSVPSSSQHMAHADASSAKSPYRSDSNPGSTTQNSSTSRSISRLESKTPGKDTTPSNTSQNHRSRSTSGFAAQPQNPEPGSADDRGMAGPHPYPNGYDMTQKSDNLYDQNFPWQTPAAGWPSTMSGRPHTQTAYKNAYSSSGFDMLGVLTRVVTRANPEINLGPIDMSCAFVVCNAEKHDFPIEYCSDNFERLTGYDKSQVLGRNCRFLQSPSGEVQSGIKRQYVDDDSVLYLKNMINARREAQISLINYRRGGQPFMNLLTMIPIAWDTGQVRYFVGFQVDLVEQPNAVTNKNADGTYSVNYQRGVAMPRYILAPEMSSKVDVGATIPHVDVTVILGAIDKGDSDYARRMWDRVLLENTDDVVHVLSLKGLFQWLSPSSKKVLEYEPGELIGTALSSVCHPSDIVPVTRELKDTSAGSPVNVVFRIRRKNSGYMWFEGHGSLHTEQGKGRKSIIMVGRERPVYTLSKKAILADGGVNESELWTKMSTSGMFLFVSSNVRQLLDRQPEDLIGVSVQTLMRAESKQEFGHALDVARTGRKATVKHEVINRRGQVLQALTTMYPGDSTEGLKPTFIVAQTRLVRFSRNGSGIKPSMVGKSDRIAETEAMISSSATSPQHQLMGQQNIEGVDASRGALALGHQDDILAADDNLFEELKTTKSSSWQYEIRQLERRNRLLAENVQSLLAAKKKRKRRTGGTQLQKDCANCHTRNTPEWRRGPSGQRDLCNSCGLRWAKINGRTSPRASSQQSMQSMQSGGNNAASDNASVASVSPRGSVVKIEPGIDATAALHGVNSDRSDGTVSGTTSAGAVSTAIGQQNTHSAQMQGASGVPERIDEGIEPDRT